MSRGMQSVGKRQREDEKARKKRAKAQKRAERRERGAAEIPIVSATDVVGNLPTGEEAMRAMDERAEMPRRSGGFRCRLFVGGLAWGTTEESLREAFAEFGEVAEAVVVKDRDTGSSRGFGFVTMEDRKAASAAIQALNDSELDGRRIVVNVATERPG